MTPNQQRAQIKNFLDILVWTELAVWIQPAVIFPGHVGSAQVTWPSRSEIMSGRLFLQDFYSIDAYFGWLEAEQFSAILFDGSILQMTFDFIGSEVKGHRLAYIPCPFLLDGEGQQLLREEPILDVITYFRDQGEDFLRLRAPVRFDFDLNTEAEEHPASHLTLNHQECRVPVRGPLSLGHFVDFVFRNFYPEQWREHEFLREQPKDGGEQTLTRDQECLIHMNWRTDIGSLDAQMG